MLEKLEGLKATIVELNRIITNEREQTKRFTRLNFKGISQGQ
jgi:hypothetical protein